jgi:RNA polymerase sigma-70 factor, ECF subfamily
VSAIPATILGPLVAAARERWPDVDLDDSVLLEQIWACRPEAPGPDELDWVQALHVGDLALARASLAGQRGAIARLEELIRGAAGNVLERHAWCGLSLSELSTTILRHLLVSENGNEPKLAQYRARGPLVSFVTVCAIRLALNDRQARSRLPSLDDAGLAERAVGSEEDPELARLKERYRPEFSAAVRETLAGLEPRARNLLKLHYLERMPCERIAALYGVHTATAWRWIEKTHRELRGAIVARLAERLGADVPDAESIVRLVGSQIDDSLRVALLDGEPR